MALFNRSLLVKNGYKNGFEHFHLNSKRPEVHFQQKLWNLSLFREWEKNEKKFKIQPYKFLLDYYMNVWKKFQKLWPDGLKDYNIWS